MAHIESNPLDSRLWTVLRLGIAVLLAVHGWTRLLGGGIVPFGDWLQTQGIYAGFYLAAAITAYEIFGTVVYALGIWVWQLALGFILIYGAGVVLVHAPFGWFVVGAGRNGMEYSVLLILCLILSGYRAWAVQRGVAASG